MVTGYSLQQRIDAFVHGDCKLEAFLQELFVLCDTKPDAAWEALALIDQYYRRGRLSADVFGMVRQRIERRVLDVPDSDATRDPPDAQAAAKVTGIAARRSATDTQERPTNARAPPARLPNVRGAGHRSPMRPANPVRSGRSPRRALTDSWRGPGRWRAAVKVRSQQAAFGGWRRFIRVLNPEEGAGIAAPRDRMRPGWRLRSTLAVLFAAVLLALEVSPTRPELPARRDTPHVEARAASPIVIPLISDPARVGLSADTYVVPAGQVAADIQVHRAGDLKGEASFEWWTQRSRGTSPGRDFVARRPTRAHFSDGADTVHLSVPILANPLRKHTELFYVAIGKPGEGVALGATTRATVIIMGPDHRAQR